MGLFVSSDVLTNSLKHILTVEAPIAMLPINSPLQTHMPFQVGLRTGLCGSLTTFASWITQMVLMIVGGKPMPLGTQWVEAIAGLMIGIFCAMEALMMGQNMALLLYHKLNPSAFVPYGSPAPEQLRLEDDSVIALQQQYSSRSQLRVSSELRRTNTVSSVREGNTTTVYIDTVPSYHEERGDATGSNTANRAVAADEATAGVASVAAAAATAGSLQLVTTTTPLAVSAQQELPTQCLQQTSWTCPAAAAAAAGAGSADSGQASKAFKAQVVTEQVKEAGLQRPLAVLLVDGFAVLSILLLTSISVWRIVSHSLGTLYNPGEPFALEVMWWSILFGPLGCYLRYYLSRYNGVLHGSWKWLPLGTFAANVGACVLDFTMKAVGVRVPLGTLQAAVVSAVVTGVGGCLSTVSTWVVEVSRCQCRVLLLLWHNHSHCSTHRWGQKRQMYSQFSLADGNWA
jgi:fluoride ion exporter CrcB/FEX